MITALAALAGGAAQAGKFKVLHSFCNNTHRPCGDGANPQAGLVMDDAGNFFGTTTAAGRDFGTAFELKRKPSGGFNFKTIYYFCSQGTCGQDPSGVLIIDTAGNLYGTAKDLVFELSPGGKKGRWNEKVLHRFCSDGCGDGNDATGGLTYAGASSGAPYDGVSPLYGVTQLGGANNGGTVFQLTKDGDSWSESVLYSFCSQGGSECTDGKQPFFGLLMSGAGDLYGTAVSGGTNQGGVIFVLSKTGESWSYTALYRFCAEEACSDGLGPAGPLVLDADGNLLGVTGGGGLKCKEDIVSGCGTIFKLAFDGSNWQETVLYAFCKLRDCKDGWGPSAGLIIDSLGNLYGTTADGGGNDIDENGLGGGVVFKLSGSSFTVLHSFCSLSKCADGEYPLAPLVMDESGELFGTSSLGGAFVDGTFGGTVFRLTP